jgi:hypothetical protein
MLVRAIHMENVKAFRGGSMGVDLDFMRSDGSLPRWIVVAGRNGAGKSTFLQAAALAIAGPSVARTVRETFADWIHESAAEASVLAHLQFSDNDGFTAAGRTPKLDPWIGLRWVRQERGPEPAMERAERGRPWDPARGPWAENPVGWFLAGYGPFRRLSIAPSEAQRLMMTPGRPAGLASLFREEASLAEAVQWLQQVYLRRLEGMPDAEQTERTILALMNDGLLPEGMHVSRVTSEGLWVTMPSGAELPLLSLSDGYRTVAALVLDIVKQLLATYGHLERLPDSREVALGHEGVVLIDEIDVHVHISWQQRIGFWLKDHFPNLQFFVSTHSPFICQAADEKGLVRLPAPGEEVPARILEGELFNRVVNGTADEAVLTDLFGLETPYSPRTLALRTEATALEGRATLGEMTVEERQRLCDIKEKLPRTPSSEVAEAGAGTRICCFPDR